ncbi:MAG: hypothetical protein LDL44_02475 [Caenispirillum sp.]|nr:hypothetical protein [Caenispirillum sp.]
MLFEVAELLGELARVVEGDGYRLADVAAGLVADIPGHGVGQQWGGAG